MKYGSVQALCWFFAFLAIAMLPAFVAYLGPGAPRDFRVELGVGLGFVGLGLMALQFVLTGRFRRVASSFGLDSMLQFHRWMGVVGVAFVLAHPAILVISDPVYLAYLDPRVQLPRAIALNAVVGAVILLVATSMWRLAFRLSYEWWRLVHALLAIFVLGVGVVHVLQVGHYVSEPWIQGFFVLVGLAGIGTVVHTRIIRPWRSRSTPWIVDEVLEEQGAAWTLRLRPEGHSGFTFLPGQFCWITLGPSPFSLQQNPYSFSSSALEAPGRLELTIKGDGDFAASVAEVTPGARAFIEGPFGSFTPADGSGLGCVMIVGGVGVTPCMSMLRTFADLQDRRPIRMIYANVSRDVTIFLRELEDLQNRLSLQVIHVFEEPPEDGEGEVGLIDRSLLDRHIPEDLEEHEYFICGPPPMMDITERSLLDKGVPQRLVFSERFDMA